jgi:hypothetical protein
VTGCPSEFAWDDRRIHGGGPEADAHAAGCPSCRLRLAERQARVAEFEASLAAPTWKRIEATVRERRRRSGRRWLLAALGAGAAVLLLVVVPRQPPGRGGPVPKGSALAHVICRRGEQTFLVAPGDEVQPGDALRFRPLPVWPGARYIQIGSVDGTGAYVPFYPAGADGGSVPLPPAGMALDGSIRLDDAPGPERLLIVLSAVPLAVQDVARAALSHAATARRIDEVGGVPVVSAWSVLPKPGGSSPEPQ